MRSLLIFLCGFVSFFLQMVKVQAQPSGKDRLNIAASAYDYPDSVFLEWKNAYLLAVENDDTLAQGRSLHELGKICYHLGYFPKALEYYLEAEKVLQQAKQTKLLAQNYIELGTLHYYNRDTQQAGEGYYKALQLFQSTKDQNGIAVSYGRIGHLAEKKEGYDSAKYYQLAALSIYEETNNQSGLAGIYENLGSIHEDLEHYDSALSYFTKAYQLYKQSEQEVAVIGALNNIGDVYRKQGQLTTGLHYSFLAMNAAEAQEERYQLSSAYRDIAQTYNLMRRYDSAYYYAELSRSLLLQIYSREGNKQMAFLQVLNDIDQKNHAISNLQKDKRFNTALTIATLIIILLLVVVGLVMLSRQRLKLRNEREINLQQSKILQAQNQLMEADRNASAIQEENLNVELRNRKLEKENLDMQLLNQSMEEQRLKQDIELKSKELSTHILHIIQKNQLLEKLKWQLEALVKDDKRDQKKQLRQLVLQISQNFNNDQNWNEFSTAFEQIHQSFFEKITTAFPELTATDLKLISLLKMNLENADMATMLGISLDSLRVSRHRLRKKLRLQQGEHLVAFLQAY